MTSIAKQLTEALEKKNKSNVASKLNERLARHTLNEGKTDFLKKIKQEISGYEDNGGGLYLFVKEGGKLYAFSGFEYNKGSMLSALKDLASGEKVAHWDNADENPKFLLKELSKSYASNLIFDNDGFYFDDMGRAASIEFKNLE